MPICCSLYFVVRRDHKTNHIMNLASGIILLLRCMSFQLVAGREGMMFLTTCLSKWEAHIILSQFRVLHNTSLHFRNFLNKKKAWVGTDIVSIVNCFQGLSPYINSPKNLIHTHFVPRKKVHQTQPSFRLRSRNTIPRNHCFLLYQPS